MTKKKDLNKKYLANASLLITTCDQIDNVIGVCAKQDIPDQELLEIAADLFIRQAQLIRLLEIIREEIQGEVK